MASLVYTGERNHVVDYLTAKGWKVDGVTRTELFVRNGIGRARPGRRRPTGRNHLHQRRVLAARNARDSPSHSTLAPLIVCSTRSTIPATERLNSAPTASGSDAAAAGCDEERGRTRSSNDEPGIADDADLGVLVQIDQRPWRGAARFAARRVRRPDRARERRHRSRPGLAQRHPRLRYSYCGPRRHVPQSRL